MASVCAALTEHFGTSEPIKSHVPLRDLSLYRVQLYWFQASVCLTVSAPHCCHLVAGAETPGQHLNLMHSIEFYCLY